MSITSIAQAMWCHGHNMQIEYPNEIKSIRRAGFFISVVPKLNTKNWFHFAIPTPVIVDGNRLHADSVMIRFKTYSSVARVTGIHVYDGETRIATHNGLTLSPTSLSTHRFDIPNNPEIFWGLGISIGVTIGSGTGTPTIEFASAGCDFFS